MVKSPFDKQRILKACFGTDEWSENSGICRNCKLKEDCGKAEKNGKSK